MSPYRFYKFRNGQFGFPLNDQLVEAINDYVLSAESRKYSAWRNFDVEIFEKMNNADFCINDVLSYYSFYDSCSVIDDFFSLFVFENNNKELIVSFVKDSFSNDSFGKLRFENFVQGFYCFVFYGFIMNRFIVKDSWEYTNNTVDYAINSCLPEINNGFSSFNITPSIYSRFIFKLCFEHHYSFVDFVDARYFDSPRDNLNDIIKDFLRLYHIYYHDIISYIFQSLSISQVSNSSYKKESEIGLQSEVFWNNISDFLLVVIPHQQEQKFKVVLDH